jgi:hypothetical protein
VKDKLVRILAEILESNPLLEMAVSRYKTKEKIGELADPLGNEILKLYLFQHSRNQNHWGSEVRGYLRTIIKKKPKGGKFSSKDYIFYNMHYLIVYDVQSVFLSIYKYVLYFFLFLLELIVLKNN